MARLRRVCGLGPGETRNLQLADHNSQRWEARSKSESFKLCVSSSRSQTTEGIRARPITRFPGVCGFGAKGEAYV